MHRSPASIPGSATAVPTNPTSPFDTALAKRYAVERELGRGGMATVYVARDLARDRLVAVKVLAPELAVSGGMEDVRRVRERESDERAGLRQAERKDDGRIGPRSRRRGG